MELLVIFIIIKKVKFLKNLIENLTLNMPATCGNYRILRTLGAGGNAVVKLVEKNGEEYAMKIFEPE